MNEPRASRLTDERQIDRAFVDALRESLGLEPLYAPARVSVYHHTRLDVGELSPGGRRSLARF